jgi:hypothetical protein
MSCFEICAQRTLVPSFVAAGVCDLRMPTLQGCDTKVRAHHSRKREVLRVVGPWKGRCGLRKTGVLEHSPCRQRGNWREDNANVGLEVEVELGPKFITH